MAELFDPLLIGILVGLIGIALWIVTNLHLVRTGRAIKADIDLKREATEEFVRAELTALKEDLGGYENAPDALGFQEEVQGLKAHLEKLDEALGEHFGAIHEVVEKLPERVKMAALSAKGVATRELMKEGDEAAEEMEQYVVDNYDPMAVAAMKVEGMKVPDTYREKNPLGAGIVDMAKEMALGWIRSGQRPGVVDMKKVSGRKPRGYR